MTTPTLRCIAHAYGDRRRRIEQALAAGVEMIEADVRWWGGRVWVRHEHHAPVLPLLWNKNLKGAHRQGPFARSAGPYWLRLDVHRLPFEELLDRTSARAGLLIDFKAARLPAREARRFVARVLRMLELHPFVGALDFCGMWELLDLVRLYRPAQQVHYSVDSEADWARVQPRLAEGDPAAGITIHHLLLTPERAEELGRKGVSFYPWDIRDADDAARVVAMGAAGILADDLDLLRSLAGTPVRLPGAA
jgi:glycerophosphoryl diester phosphodiesterase